jgi:serralysin
MSTFTGGAGNDHQETGWNNLYGNGGSDRLGADQPGVSIIDGGAGSDNLFTRGVDTIGHVYGGDGNDVVSGNLLTDQLYGGSDDDLVAGGDFLYPSSPGQSITPNAISGNDFLFGGAGTDALYGLDGDDVIHGDDGDDTGAKTVRIPSTTFWKDGHIVTVLAGLAGGEGNDILYGDKDNDSLFGDVGRDTLYGGPGADSFQFQYEIESPTGAGRDVIKDFKHSQHDHIDLYWMDAKAVVTGNQAFKFIGDKHFHDKAGEVRFDRHILAGDTDGDGKADFEIKLAGVDALHASDFYL